jgi:hypothetical protein
MLLASVSFLAGCGGMVNDLARESAPGAEITGVVHGGQNPVNGATVQLYYAASTGYGAAATPLGSPVTTVDGNFTLGSYVCPSSPNDQIYIVATGGNSGSGNNANLALMAALGQCNNVQNNVPFITINEVTTVASAYALSGFMKDYAHVGTSTGNYQGLANAMATVNNLVNIGTGVALSVTPAYATQATGTTPVTFASSVPQAEIYTLANILASCVNTNGAGGSSGNCSGLFGSSATNTTTGGVSGTPDTIQAALNIAQNPGSNVATIYTYNLPAAPFSPVVASAPNDWTIALKFIGGGLGGSSAHLSESAGLAIDGVGNIWVSNNNTNTLTELNNLGAPLSTNTTSTNGGFTGAGLNGPTNVAIDTNGNVWVGDGIAKLSEFTDGGTPVGSVTGGGLSGDGVVGLVIDGNHIVWALTQNGLSAYNSGTASFVSGSPFSANISDPNGGVAIDGSNDVWVSSGGNGFVVEFSNSGGLLYTSANNLIDPASSAIIDGSGHFWVPQGTPSQNLAEYKSSSPNQTLFNGAAILNPTTLSIDGAGHVWVLSSGEGTSPSPNLTELSSSGSFISPVNTGYLSSNIDQNSTINQADSSGNLWVLNADDSSSVAEFVGVAAPTYTPLAAAVAANKIGQKP